MDAIQAPETLGAYREDAVFMKIDKHNNFVNMRQWISRSPTTAK